jgi:hypothetical protein
MISNSRLQITLLSFLFKKFNIIKKGINIIKARRAGRMRTAPFQNYCACVLSSGISQK